VTQQTNKQQNPHKSWW